MQNLAGRYYIDGYDIWTVFSMAVEKGWDDFLKYAPRKESTTHDWSDANGLDIDTSRYFFAAREINLRCAIIADNPEQFWQKHQSLISALMQPGPRRITVSAFGNKSYYCIYQECSAFTNFSRFKEEAKVACKFTLRFIEPEPRILNDLVYLVDENGRFIVT